MLPLSSASRKIVKPRAGMVVSATGAVYSRENRGERAMQYFLMALLLLPAALAQQPPLRPVATIRQLHDAMISPASDAIFNVGIAAPKTDQEWAAMQNAAVTLAESGNLLMVGTRAKDRRGWMKMSRAMVDAAALALKAAQAHDVPALMEASDRIVFLSGTCHEPNSRQGRKTAIK